MRFFRGLKYFIKKEKKKGYHRMMQITGIKKVYLLVTRKEKIIFGVDWSLLSYPSYTYAHCFSVFIEKILNKINVLKIKKK